MANHVLGAILGVKLGHLIPQGHLSKVGTTINIPTTVMKKARLRSPSTPSQATLTCLRYLVCLVSESILFTNLRSQA